MEPERDSPYWDRIVGEDWPKISPTAWNALGTTARDGAEALNLGDAPQALRGFDDSVRSAEALQPVRAAMAALQHKPQAFADALFAAADTFGDMAELVRRTRNQILDVVAEATERVRNETRGDNNDDGKTGDEAEAETDAATTESIVAEARADVVDIVGAALGNVSPQGLPSLDDIADALGQDGPWKSGAPQPDAPQTAPGRPGPAPGDSWTPLPEGGPGIWPQEEGAAQLVPDAGGLLPDGGGVELVPDVTLDLPTGDLGDATETPRQSGPIPGQPAVNTGPAPNAPGVLGPSAGPGAENVGAAEPVASGSEQLSAGPTGPEAAPEETATTASDTDSSGDGTSDTPSERADTADTATGTGAPEPIAGAPVPVRPATGDNNTSDAPPVAPAIGLPPTAGASTGAAQPPVSARPAPGPAVEPPRAQPAPVAKAVTAPNTAPPPGATAAPAGKSAPAARAAGAPESEGPPEPDRDKGEFVKDAVGAAMMASAAPAFVVGERVDGDLVLARTLLGGIRAAVDPYVVGVDWAVSVMRHQNGVSAFVTSNEGHGWLPVGLFLPREVSLPWLWSVAENAGWEGLADPARVLAEFALAWGNRSGAKLSALASSTSMGPDLLGGLGHIALAESVPASRQMDLSSPTKSTLDRLGISGSPRLAERAAKVADDMLDRRCLELAVDAHMRVEQTGSVPLESVGVPEIRLRILRAIRKNREFPGSWWEELQDADDLLAAQVLTQRVDVSRIALGELRAERGDGVDGLREIAFQRRCNELVLLLAEPPDRQALRDAVYAHAQILTHPRFGTQPQAGPGGGTGRSTISAPGTR